MRLLLLLAALLAFAGGAAAQTTTTTMSVRDGGGAAQSLRADKNGDNSLATHNVPEVAGAAVSASNPLPTAPAPSSASSAGIAPTPSPSVGSNLVLKASAGNLYSITLSNASAGGFLMIFNLASAPADGAVTPAYCWPLNGGGFGSFGFVYPAYFSTGITAVLSSTGCFTKTTGPTGFFVGQIQ